LQIVRRDLLAPISAEKFVQPGDLVEYRLAVAALAQRFPLVDLVIEKERSPQILIDEIVGIAVRAGQDFGEFLLEESLRLGLVRLVRADTNRLAAKKVFRPPDSVAQVQGP
jgi:hypothetical protein